MNKLIRQLIKERRVTLFLAIVVAIVGIYSYYVLPRQESPDISAPVAMIITAYPGASPTDVKELVTKKIEDKISELDGYDNYTGVSKQGVSIVVVTFDGNVDNDKTMQDVRNAVTDVRSDLPDGIVTSQIKTDLIETAGIIISLSGDNYTYDQLDSFGEIFEEKLSEIDGISKFNINGKLDKEIKVNINVSKLNQLGLSIGDISGALQSQNIEIPSGSIEYGHNKITVKTPGVYSSVEDIRNLIIGISPETGIATRLKDVADVSMELEDNSEKYKQNGKNSILLTGYFQADKNIVIIGKDVRKILDEVKSSLPEDLIVEEVVYQPDDVAKSVNDFMVNLLTGILLVIVVVFLGMGLRNALVVSTAIPLSILITFSVMYFMKIQLHQLSLTALIVSLGILVDNAIVISDTVQVRIDDGEEKIEAAYNGTSVSSLPIFTATLTTIAAFLPLLGLPGLAGKFLYSIPVVLIVSIIAAYLVAMFVMPPMAAILFRAKKDKKERRNPLRVFFHKALVKALSKKKTTVAIMIGVFVFTLAVILPKLPSQFFPYADKNLFYIQIYSEISGNLEATEELTDEVVALLSNEPEIISYTVGVGTGVPKFYFTMNPAIPSADFGQMICKFDLGDKKTRRFSDKEEFIHYIQKKLDENIASGSTNAKLLAVARPVDARSIIKVSSENLDILRSVSTELKNSIAKIPGTSNVRYDLNDKTFQFEVNVDQDKATSLGITQYDIQSQINMALYGTDASVYRREGHEYTIRLKTDISSVSDLENFAIKSSATGQKILLKQFATVEYGEKLDEINTYNGKTTVEILANELAGYNPVDIEDTIENDILPQIDTKGATVTFHGEREDINDNFGAVAILSLFCLFLIYIILLIQFNSFLQPIVILLTVPLSLIGSFTGLYLFGQPLSLTAFLGIIALIGLVVKNGILLIEYINNARKEGHEIDEACIDAVDKRFNAIILSAATTVIGLVPLTISGSSLFGPMAIALMSGLTVSTFLTMVVVPVVYSMLENFIVQRKQV